MKLDNKFEDWKKLRSLLNISRISQSQKKENILDEFNKLKREYKEKYNEEFDYSSNPIRKIQ